MVTATDHCILEPEKQLPVFQEVDICVLGGSCTGVFAAVRAAQLGARVAIVEKQNAFGGVAASSFVGVWHSLMDTHYERQIIGGLTQEVIHLLDKQGAVLHKEKNADIGVVLNTEELKITLDQLVVSHKITPYLHAIFAAPYLSCGKLNGILVENKDGRGVILASQFIDATGDGDLCYRLGLDCYTRTDFQPPSATCKLWGLEEVNSLDALIHQYGKEFGLAEDWGWRGAVPGVPALTFHAETHVFRRNCSSANDLTAAEIEARLQVRKVIELIRKYATDKVGLAGLPSYLGIRETRHIRCIHRLTTQEVLYGKQFDDAIANGTYRVDIHQTNRPGILFRYLDGSEQYQRYGHPVQHDLWRTDNGPYPTYYQIPFQSLLPLGGRYENLLLAGRMLDAEDGAFGAARVMVNTNQMGEAAGVAAYLALKSGKAVFKLESDEIRSNLAALGAIML